jgi:WD40 repeat protein
VTGEDGVVRLWDLATGKETRSFRFPDVFWIRSVAFSPDGKRLAVIGDHKDSVQWQDYDHSLFICDTNTGRILFRFREDGGGFARPWFSPDGKVLAAGQGGFGKLARPQKLVFWEADTGKELRTINDILWWAWSPDGKVLASGKQRFDGIHLWDVATGKELRCLSANEPSGEAAFSPDGKTLATADDGDPSSREGKKSETAIRLWEVATGKERLRIPEERPNIRLLRFSSDGSTLVALHLGAGISLWDTRTGKLKGRPGARQDFSPSTVTFSPDGKRLYWCSAGCLREWDVSAGQEARQLGETLGDIDELLVAPDGKRLVCAGDGLSVWDIISGKELGPVGGHRGSVEMALLSPDGRMLASVDQTRALGLWDVTGGKCPISSLDGRTFQSIAVNFSLDGRRITALGVDGTVRTWNLTSGRVACEFRAGDKATTRAWRDIGGDAPYRETRLDRLAVVNPAGSLLAIARAGHAVQLWDTTTGKQQGRLEHRAPIATMVFSPGDRYLAIQDEKHAIHLWDATSGKERPEFHGEGNDGGFFFSPDDRFMAWGEGDKIHIRDLATGKEVIPFQGCLDAWHGVAFLRGSQLLAYWGEDDRLALRDVTKGTLLRTVLAAAPGARHASLIPLPDGGALAYFPVEVHRPVYALRDVLTGREICQTRGWLESIAVSPDGQVLVQAGSSIVFRERATGAVIGQVSEAHRGRVKSLRFSRDGKLLASAGWDSTLLIWDYAATVGLGRGARPFVATEQEAAWTELAGKDASQAWKAVGVLAGSGDKSVLFLRDHLRPTSTKEQETIRRWAADLDNDDFATRERASRELASLAWEAEPVLLNALAANPSAEARVRIERILSSPLISKWPSDALRKSRAVCVLENIGSPAARELLEQLAKGPPEARLTQEANASLRRLARRTKDAP